MKTIVLKFIIIFSVLCLPLNFLSQTILLNEDWSSGSFSTNGWTFPNSQPNWSISSAYTPPASSPPSARFSGFPTLSNYNRTLQSPVINAIAYTGQQVVLSYQLKADLYSSGNFSMQVQYKDIASSTWSTVATHSIGALATTYNFPVNNLLLPGMAGQNFQIRFNSIGFNSFDLQAWGLDDIVVTTSACPTGMQSSSIAASSTTQCTNVQTTLTASGAQTYTWQPGGVISPSLVVSPSVTTTYTLLADFPGCPLSVPDIYQTISVLPSPTVSISSSTNQLCNGDSLFLTASGAITYSWMPSYYLNSTTGTSVVANPQIGITYSVIGTAANGCTTVATNSILVVESYPIVSSIAATPSLVCSPGNASLTVYAGTTGWYTVTPTPYSLIPTPSTGVTKLCNNGTVLVPLTNGNLNDGDWESIPLPFGISMYNFNFLKMTIGTNGFVYFGNYSPNTYAANNFPIPAFGSTLPALFALNANLDFSILGVIEYFTVGAAPNRTLVINWTNGKFNPNTGNASVQLQISEVSTIIEIHTTSSSGSSIATSGLNFSTFWAVPVPGRNAVAYSVNPASPDAYRFIPIGGLPTYTWSPATNLSSTTGSVVNVMNATSTTVYTVTIGTGNCTRSFQTTLLVSTCTGEEDNIQNESRILISPNPGKEIFEITSTNEALTEVTVYSEIGATLLKQRVNEAQAFLLNMSSFNNGIYYLRIKIAGKTINKKIIKE